MSLFPTFADPNTIAYAAAYTTLKPELCVAVAVVDRTAKELRAQAA
jgi:hypothetical protein